MKNVMGWKSISATQGEKKIKWGFKKKTLRRVWPSLSNILAEYFPVEENQQKKILREAIPPSPFYEAPIYFFPDHFLIEKKMILKVVWRVLMGVLRVLEGCCRVFEVCLEGVWKNKIEVWNQSDPPPPFSKIFSKKIFFSRMRASQMWLPKLSGKCYYRLLRITVDILNSTLGLNFQRHGGQIYWKAWHTTLEGGSKSFAASYQSFPQRLPQNCHPCPHLISDPVCWRTTLLSSFVFGL